MHEEARDRWGNVIRMDDFASENRPVREEDGTYTIRVWQWADLGFSRPHGCQMWGWRWAVDCPDVRAAHPDGCTALQPIEEGYGWAGGYNRPPQAQQAALGEGGGKGES